MITKPENQKSAAVAGLLFLISLLVFLFAMDRSVSVYDESLVLLGATRVMQGAVIHRDFYANYGPAQFYVLAGLFKVFGTSVLVERIWDVAVRAGIVVVSFLLIERISSRRSGVIGAVLVAVWVCGLGFHAFPIYPALLTSLIAVLLLSMSLESNRPQRLLLVGGVMTGITVLFRYDAGFYAVFAMTLALLMRAILYPRVQGRKWLPEILGVLFPFFVGVATVCVPVTLALIASGAIDDLLFDAVLWPAQWYGAMRGLPFPNPFEMGSFHQVAPIYFPIVVWFAGLAVVFFNHSSERSSPVQIWTTLTLCVLSALFYLKGLVRVSTIHMGMSIIPALIVTASLVNLHSHRLILRGVAYASLLCMFLLILPTTIKKLARGAQWITANPSPLSGDSAASASCAPEITRLACFAADSPWHIEAIKFVRERTEPGEPIFVGLSRHDKIFVNDMLFYFLADRPPATKWHHFDPGLQTTEKIQLEIIGELQKSKTRFIVLRDEWGDMQEPNASALSSGVEVLDVFIRKNYQLIQSFGNIWVFQAREPSSAGG